MPRRGVHGALDPYGTDDERHFFESEEGTEMVARMRDSRGTINDVDDPIFPTSWASMLD